MTLDHESQRIPHALTDQAPLEPFLRWQIVYPVPSLLRTNRFETPVSILLGELPAP
jgi:hypothetical protein